MSFLPPPRVRNVGHLKVWNSLTVENVMDVRGNFIHNLQTPIGDADAVNKKYVDNLIAHGLVYAGSLPTATGQLVKFLDEDGKNVAQSNVVDNVGSFVVPKDTYLQGKVSVNISPDDFSLPTTRGSNGKVLTSSGSTSTSWENLPPAIVYNGSLPTAAGQLVKFMGIDGKDVQQSSITDDIAGFKVPVETFLENKVHVNANPDDFSLPTTRGTIGQVVTYTGTGVASWEDLPKGCRGMFYTTPSSITGFTFQDGPNRFLVTNFLNSANVLGLTGFPPGKVQIENSLGQNQIIQISVNMSLLGLGLGALNARFYLRITNGPSVTDWEMLRLNLSAGSETTVSFTGIFTLNSGGYIELFVINPPINLLAIDCSNCYITITNVP